MGKCPAFFCFTEKIEHAIIYTIVKEKRNKEESYITLDLEATCEDRKLLKEQNREFKNEIIEIGAVKINEQGEIVDSFSQFVKPILKPVLTDYCKELTKITQTDIDEAEGFSIVLKAFQEWMGEDYQLCSWGFYDKKQLRLDCERHDLDSLWLRPHISLKHQYQEIRHLTRGVGVRKALAKEGFQFDGTPHRGIDDARNIAKIFLKLKDQWTY